MGSFLTIESFNLSAYEHLYYVHVSPYLAIVANFHLHSLECGDTVNSLPQGTSLVMSNLNPVGSSKSPAASNQVPSLQQNVNTSLAGDVTGQRRSGGSGSFGSGANTRPSASPRNSQGARKQHKSSKRSRLADDDAMALSVRRM